MSLMSNIKNMDQYIEIMISHNSNIRHISEWDKENGNVPGFRYIWCNNDQLYQLYICIVFLNVAGK